MNVLECPRKLYSKCLVSGLYNPNIPHLYVGYNPLTNHLLTSWDIQVDVYKYVL